MEAGLVADADLEQRRRRRKGSFRSGNHGVSRPGVGDVEAGFSVLSWT